jgi:L-malate glycosyltransferase
MADTPGVRFRALDGGAATLAPGELDLGWSNWDIRRAAAGLARSVTRYSIQILHFHYAAPFALVAQEVRRRMGPAGPAIVGTLHGTDVTTRRDPAEQRALRQALLRLDATTAVSASHAALAAGTLGLREPPETIPNFVDLSRFSPLPARSPGRPRVVHMSNFRAVKDPLRMSRIFRALRRAIDAELWLIGDGPLLPAVRVSLAGCPDTRYLGLLRAVRPVLAAADLLLLTSKEESFSLATLEAAACAVPTVAPNVGGLPEVIGDGGVLYDRDDDRAAVDAVLGLLRDPMRRQIMAKAALAQAERFSADAVVPRYEALYRRLVAYPDAQCAP